MTIRERVLRLLRVPPRPSAPDGDANVHVLRASPNWFWYRVLHWFVKHGSALIGLVVGLRVAGAIVPGVIPDGVTFGFVTISGATLLAAFRAFEVGAVIAFAVQAVSSLVLLRLDFEQRWYIVSDRSLRIREGMIRLREQTVTYANVQHVSVRQGPLQRLFGIADLQVRSAGGKGSDEDGAADDKDPHVAHMRGIANPDRVRDAIRERLRKHRDAGLGDPDDPDPHHPSELTSPSHALSHGAPELVYSALELSREARLLRLAVENRSR